MKTRGVGKDVCVFGAVCSCPPTLLPAYIHRVRPCVCVYVCVCVLLCIYGVSVQEAEGGGGCVSWGPLWNVSARPRLRAHEMGKHEIKVEKTHKGVEGG